MRPSLQPWLAGSTWLEACWRDELPAAQIFSQRLAEDAIPALHCIQLLRFCAQAGKANASANQASAWSITSFQSQHWRQRPSVVQLELPLGLEDEKRRPGAKRGIARWVAHRAVDRIRGRFGWEAVGYGSLALGASRLVPDEFREFAEKEL